MIHYVSHRYYQPIKFLVSGMGAAVIMPWVILAGRRQLLLNSSTPAPSGDVGRLANLLDLPWAILFIGMWLFLIGLRYLFDRVGDWFNGEGEDGLEDELVWRFVIVGLMVILLPILNRILLYSYAQAPMFAPTRGVLNALFNFTEGWRPENTLIFFYLASWFFVIWAASNVMGLFEIGRLFQFGLFLCLVGIGWLAGLGETAFVGLFIPFIGCGLLALALSQVDSKVAWGGHSFGARFSMSTSAQLYGIIAVIVFVSSWLANVILPDYFRAVLRIFKPLWDVVLFVLLWAGSLLWIVLEPILEFLFEGLTTILREIMSRIAPIPESGDADTAVGPDFPTASELLSSSTGFRYLVIGFAVILGLIVVWVVLNRTVLKRYRDNWQETVEESVSSDSNLWSNAFGQLRSWFDRFRNSRPKSLLEPDSVEHIYANVCRLASRQGFQRAVSQPPDQYLPILAQAFPDHQQQLAEITESYMQVHYGNQQVSQAEFMQMQSYYHQLAAAIQEEKADQSDQAESA